MHLRNEFTFSAHGPACCWADELTLCCCANSVFWGAASAGALLPPLNQPPTAWPIEDPTATPLVVLAAVVVWEGLWTYAAVDAIWPNSPGPWGVAAAGGGCGAAAGAAGAAAVECWRAGAGAGFAAGTVGRGRTGAAPPRWRGMVDDGWGFGWVLVVVWRCWCRRQMLECPRFEKHRREMLAALCIIELCDWLAAR